MDAFLQLTVGGIRIGVIYGLVALGLVVIYKSTRTVNFAHGAFVMLGAYAGALAAGAFSTPFVVNLLLGAVAMGLFAAISQLVILRPLRRLDPFSAVIATVAFGVLLMALARVRYGSAILSLDGPGARAPIRFGPVVITAETILLVALSVGVVVATLIFFRVTPLGMVFRGVADNPTATELCGFNIERLQTGAWAIGGGLAGAGGVMIAPITGVSPDLMLLIVPAFVVAVVGGFESLEGALLGGLAVGLAETYVAGYVTTGGKQAIGLLAMLLILYFRPQGLFAELEVTKV